MNAKEVYSDDIGDTPGRYLRMNYLRRCVANLCGVAGNLVTAVQQVVTPKAKLEMDGMCVSILWTVFDMCKHLRINLKKACGVTLKSNSHSSQVPFYTNEVRKTKSVGSVACRST